MGGRYGGVVARAIGPGGVVTGGGARGGGLNFGPGWAGALLGTDRGDQGWSHPKEAGIRGTAVLGGGGGGTGGRGAAWAGVPQVAEKKTAAGRPLVSASRPRGRGGDWGGEATWGRGRHSAAGKYRAGGRRRKNPGRGGGPWGTGGFPGAFERALYRRGHGGRRGALGRMWRRVRPRSEERWTGGNFSGRKGPFHPARLRNWAGWTGRGGVLVLPTRQNRTAGKGGGGPAARGQGARL